ncbi:MAG TPA: NAD(P)-binding domain-containing protein [Holophagaceae bacterium]|jgi:predicted dinucleotide-binding enzyme|nr:NAD(P)-binding domain-containing protein [Holophagaceae bacterium]
MKIGILGSGSVAQTLGAGFLAKGHEVRLGTRDTSKLKDWVSGAGKGASAGSFSEAAAFGGIVFLCTLGEGALEALKLAGADNLRDKVLVDVTNPLDFSGGVPPHYAAMLGNSLGEQVQRAHPEARVVKAFNTIAAQIMVSPQREEGLPTLTICGEDAAAKAEVTKLAEAFGWEVADLGGIDMAYWNEALAMVWILYGFKNNHWTHAFKLLKK